MDAKEGCTGAKDWDGSFFDDQDLHSILEKIPTDFSIPPTCDAIDNL